MTVDSARVVVVEATTEDAELVADHLWRLGASAIEERDVGRGRVALVAGVPDPDAAAVAVGGTVVEVDLAGALDAWRRHASPVVVGDRLVVVPAWLEPPPGPLPQVVIEPERTFGSGEHTTTRLVLDELVTRLRPGQRVLDVGCGSGVLAVAAAVLGAARVDAVDTDPEAVRVTAANADRNGVAARVGARAGSVGAAGAGSFDLVLANLAAPVLVALASELAEAVAPEGRLVVSGLLAGRWQHVAEAFEGLTVEAVHERDGWAALTLRR